MSVCHHQDSHQPSSSSAASLVISIARPRIHTPRLSTASSPMDCQPNQGTRSRQKERERQAVLHAKALLLLIRRAISLSLSLLPHDMACCVLHVVHSESRRAQQRVLRQRRRSRGGEGGGGGESEIGSIKCFMTKRGRDR